MTSRLIIISILFAVTAGCKKNRTCVCGHARMDGSWSETYKDTKKSAGSKCKNLDEKWKQEDPEYTCSLEQ
jgi:hypothetical protein